jgi:two-component system, OmpR family, copper resistance phosphate regulon response regulator CusR
MRILLVQPEAQTAAYLRKGLIESGFAVDVAGETNTAREINYDLLVCDPGADPRAFAEQRHRWRTAPVLFLTPPDGAPARRAGASFSELLNQVRFLLHEAPGGTEEALSVADLEISLIRHRAWRGGRRLDLTPKEFLLLSLLVRRAGEVLSRTLIADQVWDISFEMNTNVVDVHIRRLRSKVDDPFPKKLIHTVRGAGYVLEHREATGKGS